MELVADSRVIALYGEIVRDVNGGLANFETIKRFRVVADEWSQESGELTPSMKLKRRVITGKYAAIGRRTLRRRSNRTRRIGGVVCVSSRRSSTRFIHMRLECAKEGCTPCAHAENAAEQNDGVDAESA